MGKALLSAGRQSSANPEPYRSRMPSRRVPRATVRKAFAEEKLQERRLQSPRLSVSIIVLTADTDLHSNTVNTLSCSGLSLPHLHNCSQAGSFYTQPSTTVFDNGISPAPGVREQPGQQAVLHGGAGAGSAHAGFPRED